MNTTKLVILIAITSGLLLGSLLIPNLRTRESEPPIVRSDNDSRPQLNPVIGREEKVPQNQGNLGEPKEQAFLQGIQLRQIINGTPISASIRVVHLNPGSGRPNALSINASLLNANPKLKQIILQQEQEYAQFLEKCRPANGRCTNIKFDPPDTTSITLNATEATYLISLLQLVAEGQTTGKGGVVEVREVRHTRIIEGPNPQRIDEIVQEEVLVQREPRPSERVIGNWISATYTGALLYNGNRYGVLVIVAFEK